MIRLLGKGAQARVYLAWDRRTRSWVAAKVLTADLLDNADIRRRFEQEAHTMARLQHPHLLRVFDVGADGGVPWIIMELAACGAVTEWVRRNGVMPPAMAIAVVVQAAEGLDLAHRRGVIHRDVKPHNLLIIDRQRIVVTDFGVAQAADASMTATGTVMGTFAYMAPEQRNDAKSVDGRSDMYALSASLYSLISGKPSAELFYAEADDEIMEAIPAPLRPVIIKACAYRREDRYPTMKAFAKALVAADRRLPRVDPTTPSLDDGRLRLPLSPPDYLEPGALDMSGEVDPDDQPTYVPSSRDALEQALDLEPGILLDDEQDAPTEYVVPERPAVQEPTEPSTMRPVTAVESPTPRDSTWMNTAALVLAVALAVLVGSWGMGVSSNVMVRWELERQTDALLDNAQIAASGLSAVLEAGADEKRLTAAWDDFQTETDPSSALAFADLIQVEAARIEVDDLAMTRIHPLLASAKAYRQAEQRHARQPETLMGRLSLGVGR